MDGRMWTKRIALVALALFVAGCGPKTEEVGGAIMIATPLALLAMILPTLILRKVSRLSPRMSTGRDFLPLSVAIIGAMSASMVGALQYFSFSEDIELLGIAAIAASSSAMLYGMISWAFTERRRPEQPYGRFLLPTLLLTHIIPSALLLFHHQLGLHLKSSDGQGIAVWLWAIPGCYFIPGALLFFIFLALAFRDRARRAKQESIAGADGFVADVMS